jgi:peptidoglycan hydrolase CwlO-like protein
MQEDTVIELMETAERLQAVTVALEAAAAKLAEQQQSVGPIVAAVESEREAELERRLEEAEARIAELTAAAATAGRKTLPSGMASMLAKQGVTVESMEAGAIDAALSSLSIEQRIAVKAELLRAGLLG